LQGVAHRMLGRADELDPVVVLDHTAWELTCELTPIAQDIGLEGHPQVERHHKRRTVVVTVAWTATGVE
jgi:hypothetical protein